VGGPRAVRLAAPGYAGPTFVANRAAKLPGQPVRASMLTRVGRRRRHRLGRRRRAPPDGPTTVERPADKAESRRPVTAKPTTGAAFGFARAGPFVERDPMEDAPSTRCRRCGEFIDCPQGFAFSWSCTARVGHRLGSDARELKDAPRRLLGILEPRLAAELSRRLASIRRFKEYDRVRAWALYIRHRRAHAALGRLLADLGTQIAFARFSSGAWWLSSPSWGRDLRTEACPQ